MYINKDVQHLLKAWKKESKNPHLCLYKMNDANTLVIYTDRPGYLIGRAGELSKKYRELILKASFGTIKDISFVETYGIF